MGWVQNDVSPSPPRLAKSTLTLIPLLGTHEIIFAFVIDEHARGTLRFIKLFTELSFTSFQVTVQPSLVKSRGGLGQRPACTMQMRCLRPGGKVALAQGYVVAAEPELEALGVLTSRPIFSISILGKKSYRI